MNRKNSKYFIDYTNEKRECGYCREIKPFKQFHINSNKLPKTFCKICESALHAEKQRLKRQNKNPERYQACLVCGEISSLYLKVKRCDCNPGAKHTHREEVKEGL